jgi:hypothetical protein
VLLGQLELQEWKAMEAVFSLPLGEALAVLNMVELPSSG